MKDRRELLKGLAVGSAWATPVVSSVVLPVHAATTGVIIISGGGGGRDEVSASLPVLDYLIPQALAKGSDFVGCAQFHWRLNDEGNMVETDSVVLDIVTRDCDGYTDTNLEMVYESENVYKANGGTKPVQLTITNPSAEPGKKLGVCQVNEFNPFDVIRGESCIEYEGVCVSDIRLKTDVQALGETPAGISIYRYKYISDETQTDYVGVMAQDLTDSYPHALVIGEDGFYRVKYGDLGMRMATYEEYKELGTDAVHLFH